jgi:hypothetical protein
MNKALIKDTQEILEVENEYNVFFKELSFEYKIEDIDFLETTIKSQKFINMSERPKKEGTWFLLSDGKEYHQDELVVGQEEIREYQLNKIV